MSKLPIQDLEQVYDNLAQAIDAATPEKAELFLAKLALLAAETLGDAKQFMALIEVASQDL